MQRVRVCIARCPGLAIVVDETHAPVMARSSFLGILAGAGKRAVKWQGRTAKDVPAEVVEVRTARNQDRNVKSLPLKRPGPGQRGQGHQVGVKNGR